MVLPPVGPLTCSPVVLGPNVSLDLADLLAKAKVYAEQHALPPWDGEPAAKQKEMLLTYITDILNNEEFQSNHQAFLKKWEEIRGYTEEFRYPEDQARLFFDEHFKAQSPF